MTFWLNVAVMRPVTTKPFFLRDIMMRVNEFHGKKYGEWAAVRGRPTVFINSFYSIMYNRSHSVGFITLYIY